MNQAQRRRDAALRRLRLANRGGLTASVVGAAVVIGLAHQATPVGKSRRVSAQVVVKHRAEISRPNARAGHTEKVVKHRITPAAAPTAITTTPKATSPTANSAASAGDSASATSTASVTEPATVAPSTPVAPVAAVTSGAS